MYSRSNWNLEVLVFMEEENRRTRRKTLGARTRTNNKLNPHMVPGRNRTRAILVGGECSHHCATPAPQWKYQPLLPMEISIFQKVYYIKLQSNSNRYCKFHIDPGPKSLLNACPIENERYGPGIKNCIETR